MSSLEISELTGKHPADVMPDIRKMLEKLGEGTERTFTSSYTDTTGRSLPCFNLPRRETDVLLTGYNVVLRAKVIDRWRDWKARSQSLP